MNSLTETQLWVNERLAAVDAMRTTITTPEQAQALGKIDALVGMRCQPDRYQYPDDARYSHLRGDYVYSFITAKGL